MTDQYVELHCHSHFSLLDGASHPEELTGRAVELGMPALALTDHDAVYGAPRFHRAARDQGLRPILGAELTLTDSKTSVQQAESQTKTDPIGVHHLTLLVENEAGWHNLCYLISRARHGMPKGEALLKSEELVGCTNGLIALSGCRHGKVARALILGDRESALAAARRYRELFGRDGFWIELQRHHLPGDVRLSNKLAALASYLRLGCVVTNNVHYHRRDRHRLQDVLVCIQNLTSLDQAAGQHPTTQRQDPLLRRLNSEYYLKSATQMAALFPDQPQALANTFLLAERCLFDLRYGLQDLPSVPTPHGMSSSAYLRRLCEESLEVKYAEEKGIHRRKSARRILNHELKVIEGAGLANYFLIVWDIVRFSREAGIRCQGRGSAANSLVAYLLHISPIDPVDHDLVFERFLSEERQAVPDIDIDFDAQRREEVIQYIYERYGPDHTAMACTFVTFRSRSAIRDIGKALDLPPLVIASTLENLDRPEATEEEVVSGPPVNKNQASIDLLLDLAGQIEGFPRHLGIHSGGMIITGPPMMGRVPTEPATMPDRVVVQWDKDGLEDAGLVKIDILGLRMLSAITDSISLIKKSTGQGPDLDGLNYKDPAVYEMISRADTIGVFQVESRAQAQMLPRMRPNCFNDLVVAISLIRPGPIQGNMVHPYLRRRLGLEPVVYAHPLLEQALSETLGVILFQEQVLKVARDLAGFTEGQGELLRRALGSKRAREEIESFHQIFLQGAVKKDVPEEMAEAVFDQLRAFGGYSFAKSHAAAFSILVYQSAWLKHYHFVPFYAALLNNQPMGFWNPAVLVNETRRRGVKVLPVDLHLSQAECTVVQEGESQHIRLGFNYVKALHESHVELIMIEREKRAFTDLVDFYRRVRPGHRVTENLIRAGAMDGWGYPRRQLLWELGTLKDQRGELDLAFKATEVELPRLSPAEAMLEEQEILGLSTGDHVMTFYRAWLQERGILGSEAVAKIKDGQRVRVAGLVVVHQAPPTAKGHHFLTLEDEDGMLNIIIRPRIYERFRRTLRSARLLMIAGTVQQEDGVTSILAQQAAPLQN